MCIRDRLRLDAPVDVMNGIACIKNIEFTVENIEFQRELPDVYKRQDLYYLSSGAHRLWHIGSNGDVTVSAQLPRCV